MAITIKKSTLTLKRTEEAPVAAPHLTSGPVLSARESGPAWTGYAICGLIAMFCLLGLLVFQYIEYTHYQDAFPLRVPQTAAVSAPAGKTEPAAAAPAEKAKPDAAKPAEAKTETAAAAPAEKTKTDAATAAAVKAEPAAAATNEKAEAAAPAPAVETPAAKEAPTAPAPAAPAAEEKP